MTLVEIDLRVPVADGTLAPASGFFRFTPTRRRAVGGVVVLPGTFTEQLALGTASVELEPTTTEWVWRIDEHATSLPTRAIYVSIPDVESVNYADLVSIDPKTLDPTSAPPATWTIALAEAEARLSQGTLTPDPDDPGFFLIGAS